MSEDPTPQADSASPQPEQDPLRADKKNRSSVERAIVWGGILVLLLLVGIQAHARKGYEWTLEALTPLINDDAPGREPLAITDVDTHVAGFPSQTETEISATKTERVYRWRGLRGSYGITLVYDPSADTPVVTSLVTDGAPEPPPPVIVEGERITDEMAAPGEPPFPGSPAPGGDSEGAGPGGEDQPQQPSIEGADDSAPEGATADDESVPAESATDESSDEEPAQSP